MSAAPATPAKSAMSASAPDQTALRQPAPAQEKLAPAAQSAPVAQPAPTAPSAPVPAQPQLQPNPSPDQLEATAPPPPKEIAPIWSRIAARATDLLVVFFIEFILVIVQIFWFMDSVSRKYDFEPWGRPFMASMIFIGLYAIYETFFHTFAGGQTPGKILLRIKVVRRKDEKPPSLLQSFARWPLAGIALPLLFAPNATLWFAHYKLWALALWLAPGITAFLTKNHLSIHDLAAGTKVVRHIQTDEELKQIAEDATSRKEIREKYGFGFFRRLR